MATKAQKEAKEYREALEDVLELSDNLHRSPFYSPDYYIGILSRVADRVKKTLKKDAR